MEIKLVLPAVVALSVMVAGCGNNQLAQPMPGQTPESINKSTPGYGEAGGPLVPANNPNAGSTIPVTPKGGTGHGAYGSADYPLTPANSPAATPDAASTQSKQDNSGYFPAPDTPLAPR